jgi:ubiquinone/menaquinone biosynthesis C-methylase UbiE
MSRPFVDYNQFSEDYDQRYSLSRLDGIASALHETLTRTPSQSILEVGCGTGRWLSDLAPRCRLAAALDLSVGMLLEVAGKRGRILRVCGSAERVPFSGNVFDLVVCVNVIHHLEDPGALVAEAARLLRPGGALAIVGLDPHQGTNRWYLYEYFPETRALDLERYPSAAQVRQWMVTENFVNIEAVEVERVQRKLAGGEILEDYFLQRKASSQLAMLTEEAWAEGLHRIRHAIEEGEARGAPAFFEVDLRFDLICGWRLPGAG